MDPVLLYALVGCLVVIVVTWALGLLTGEHSWVDRIWSIVPIPYVAWFAWQTGFADTRLVVMTLLVLAWGVRLTFNFARKGGYAKGGEDYRWPVLRARMPRWQWEIFALLFIAGFQNVLLLLITLPAWAALEGATTRPEGGVPFGALDAIATVLFVLFLIGETIADEQQWRFHREKKARLARGETVDPPFLTTGLFAWSRHPNFFCEQAQWVCLCLFAVSATGTVGAWVIGAVILVGLFQGSTNFTEELTRSKYPSYAEYQKRVSRLLPLPPRA
ncbi:MAG: DUF1295 domain-containing protein [Deltaproteobacteria bacterium]|nr:DUF1295 domain-containing protein [Deltaproteobacteria bacterium]